MFGLFKKKETSKTVQKIKPIEKQPSGKKIEAHGQFSKTKNEKKFSEKLMPFHREDTEGQFIQKRKVRKTVQHKKKQEQFNGNNITTPKIPTNKNIKDFEQKVTQRPHKILTEPYELDEDRKVPPEQQLRYAKYQEDDYQDIRLKQVINLKSINKLLKELKNITETQNQIVISRNLNSQKEFKEVHLKLFYSKYFRFYHVKNMNDLIERYGQIVQGLQLLISKLSNRIGKGVHFHKNDVENEQKLQKIYISDESEFLLFFKHFFSKPYTLCNRASMRKIIQVIWQSISFKVNNVQKLYEQLKLWIYGISIPSNPSLITLQKVVLKNSQAIPKYAKMILNDKIYMGINEADPLIKTPLTMAVEIQNKKAIEKLIKCGANPHLASYYTKKGEYSFEYSQTKYKKHIFTINYPQYSKKVLSPMENLLFLKQDPNLLSETMYFMEIANIRKLRKQTEKIKEKLKQIPDCTFQIAWKTYRGILSFKELPSDIITVYKKDSRLRIDYNIDSIQNPVKGKHFTILIKAQNQKPFELYEIRHHSKTILNRMTEIDMGVIKERLNQFCSYPHARNSEILQCKGMFEKKSEADGKKLELQMNLSMYNQIVTPEIKKTNDFKKPVFKNTSQYEKVILDSELIDYRAMEKSQVEAVIQENIVHQKLLPAKLKSKVEKSNIGLEMQFQEELLNLKHLEFIMQFFKTDSVLINKFLTIMKVFENQDTFGKINISKYLPVFGKINLQRDLSFQMDIKNLNFISINDNVFNVECKVVSDMNYEENINPRALDSMQETVLMEEGYSINVSQFLGKTQKLLELQEEYARDKFEKMLEAEYCSDNVSINGNILDDLEDDD